MTAAVRCYIKLRAALPHYTPGLCWRLACAVAARRP